MVSCINKNNKVYQLAVKTYKSENAAVKVYLENNQEWPQEILDEAAKDDTIDLTETFISDPGLLNKEMLIQKSQSILEKKIKRLSHSVKDNPSLKQGVLELQALATKLNRLEADYALVEFAKAAESMTNSAINWLADMDSGKRAVTTSTLSKIRDYTESFDLIKEIES